MWNNILKNCKMKTRLLLFALCVFSVSCTQNNKSSNKQDVVEDSLSTSKDTTALNKIEDENTEALKEFISQLNIRDFFHPRNKETELFVVNKDSKFRDVYSVVKDDGDYITVNKAYLFQYGEQWTVANDSYITYSIKNNEITQIKSNGESCLDGTYSDSHSELILKLPINNDSIKWESEDDDGNMKGKNNYSAQLKYFKAEKVKGGFIQIPAIELTMDAYVFKSDSGKWERALTRKEYWGKGWGLLLITLPYDNNSVNEYNSEIKPSTYQILDFEDGYKEEKGIKQGTTNDENILTPQLSDNQILSIDTFSTFPSEISGCGCYFSINSAEFKKDEYIFMCDIDKTSFLKINGVLTKFTLIEDSAKGEALSGRFKAKFKSDNYEIEIEYSKTGEHGYESSNMKGTIKLTDKNGKTVVKTMYGLCGC